MKAKEATVTHPSQITSIWIS